jgi:hypothetical protein
MTVHPVALPNKALQSDGRVGRCVPSRSPPLNASIVSQTRGPGGLWSTHLGSAGGPHVLQRTS